MSNILRRPMFRGGRVNSRGTGITSGLDRVGMQGGGMPPQTTTGGQLLNQALGQPGTLIGDTNRLLGNVQEKLFNYVARPMGNIPIAASNYAFGTGFDYIPPMDYEKDVLDLIEKSQIRKKSKSGAAQADEIGLDDDVDTDDATIAEMRSEGTDVKRPVPRETEKSNTIIPKKKPIDLGDDDEVSLTDVEKAKKEYAELLGIEKARSRDISDMLGRFSAAALQAPSLREAFADYMALEAKAGPGRTERIQETAGALAAKEKISDKQLDKRLAAALASKQFKASDLQKRVEYLKELGYKQDTAVRMALKEPASFAEELQNASKALGTVTDSSFLDAARIFYKDQYKGDFDTVATIKPDKTVDLADGVYTDSKNRKVYRVTSKKVTELY